MVPTSAKAVLKPIIGDAAVSTRPLCGVLPPFCCCFQGSDRSLTDEIIVNSLS